MKKHIIALVLVLALCLSLVPPALAAEGAEGIIGSIRAETYSLTSTATCTPLTDDDSNAADFTSVRVEAEAGDTLVYENLDFTGAKVLMLEAAVDSGSEAKTIQLYIDSILDANRIGTLTTHSTAKENALDFNEQYASLTAEVTGTHALILQFESSVSLELDWLKLTSYTGAETEAERDARMQWWRDAKFGQFIHLGAYSYLGGWYNGQKGSFYSEWIMDSLHISKEDYAEAAAAYFNPEQFDAEKIVSDAKTAGQKYLVITARHHEGFSIFDTQIRNFKDYSLFSMGAYEGPDILKELAEECRAQGLHFGVYITIMDWYDPSQTGWNYNSIAEDHTKEEYKSQLKGQLKELIEKYGVEIFFFDGEWVNWWTKEDGQELYRYILSLNENCIVNNRVGKRAVDDGDYGTPEQEIPATGLDYDWESNVTMNDNWGYCIGDNNWKSSQWIVESVLDIASKGGNLLLNVGPDGTGVVQQEPIERMAAAGTWFAKFGDAIYGTRASCFESGVPGNVRVTTKPDEGKVYVSLLRENPNSVGSITIPALENQILRVKDLATGGDVPFSVVNGKMQLTISGTPQQQYATVYEITVDGMPTEAESTGDPRINLALHKQVTPSSEYDSAHGAACLVDGVTAYDAQKDNRWAPLDNNSTQWVSVDLGEKQTIREVVAYEWWDQFFDRNYRCAAYKVYVSDNNAEWAEVASGTTIGERQSIVLEEPVEARYVKLETTSGSSSGSVGLQEVQIFGELLPNPQIAITNTRQLVETMPFRLEGTYADGASVEVKVWSASFAAFTVEAVVDAKQGTWVAEINRPGIQPTELTLTAMLQAEDEQVVALDVFQAEYTGRENLADGAASSQSTYYIKPGVDHSAAALVNGSLSGDTDRWAPADNDNNPWAVIDLGSVEMVGEIVLYEWWDTYFDLDYRCGSLKISVSDDNQIWKEVYAGTSIGRKLTVTLDTPVKARYVKIHDIQGSAHGNVSLHEVAVYEPQSISVTGVVLDQTTAFLEVGETLTLEATVVPETATDKSVTWSSDNTDVATVENGVVTAVAAGTAQITVTAANGKVAACIVTVTEETIPASDLAEIAEMLADQVSSVAQSRVNSGAAARAYVQDRIEPLLPDSVTSTVTSVSFTAAKAGTLLQPKGVNGAYVFTVTLTDGTDIYTTGVITLVIEATEYQPTVLPILPGVGSSGATDKPVVQTEFYDVAYPSWYYDAVAYVCENSYMNGVAEGRFNPDGSVTRAMVWTVLARMDGVNTEGGSTWYSNAQQWAVETGVSDGTDPMGSITREQLAAMLYRYEGSPAVSGNLNAYPDANHVSDWAVDALVWATQTGLINGINGNLSYKIGATRAQLATMLMRMLES